MEAVHRLGASSESVTFLRLPGGAANHHVHEITHAVVSMLNSWRPQSVFVNYGKDPTSDHVAVNAAVRAAFVLMVALLRYSSIQSGLVPLRRPRSIASPILAMLSA
ncbi:hypothetical protein L2331_32040 [Mesorhizobium muleiense]|nr:hypothetical protein [Mesorhizobium muleiense]